MSTRTISVSLPNAAVYVSGTVNGAAVTWTLNGEAWEAIAKRDMQDVYRVAITAVTANGMSYDYALTLYYGASNLITWRTQADADRASYLLSLWGPDGFSGTETEKAEYMGGLIGAYNAEDLNRVGAAAEYLSNRLDKLGYSVTVQAKTGWEARDVPTKAQTEQYLDNVSALREAIAVLPGTPPVPESMEGLTWQKANDIEQILFDINALLNNMEDSFVCSGEVYSGEV